MQSMNPLPSNPTAGSAARQENIARLLARVHEAAHSEENERRKRAPLIRPTASL